MSGPMELFGLVVLVFVIWGTARVLDDGMRRTRRHRCGASVHTYGDVYTPCAGSPGYGVPLVAEAAPLERDAAPAPSCSDDSSGRSDSGHWWSGDEDDSSSCSDSGGSWDFGDD